jgi:hypothetical protein
VKTFKQLATANICHCLANEINVSLQQPLNEPKTTNNICRPKNSVAQCKKEVYICKLWTVASQTKKVSLQATNFVSLQAMRFTPDLQSKAFSNRRIYLSFCTKLIFATALQTNENCHCARRQD